MAASTRPISTPPPPAHLVGPRAKHLDRIASIVRPHGKLDAVTENLWHAWITARRGGRARSLVLARRRDGDLVIHDPAALDADEMRVLEAIGAPRYIVVPDAEGGLDARAFTRRHPGIQVFAPRAARDTVANVVRVDGIFEDFPVDADVELRTLRGIDEAAAVFLVRSSDGLTVVTPELDTYLRPRGLLRLLGGSTRRALVADLERYVEHPDLVRVVAGARVLDGPSAARTLLGDKSIPK